MESFGLTENELALVKAFEDHVRGRVLKSNENPRLQALLMWAVHYASLAQLQKILAAGANPNFDLPYQTMLGEALHWRGDKDGPDVFRELVRAGADPTRHSGNKSLMWTASQHGNRQWAIGVLLDVVPKKKLAPEDLTTALVNTAHDAALVKRLLDAGVDVNRRGSANNAFLPAKPISPLMAAAFYGNPDCVQLLLTAGADANLKDAEGHTALDYALFDAKRCRKVIALLQKAGGASAKSFPDPGAATRGFATAAKKPAFKAAVASIQELTGIKPAPLVGEEGKVPGGYGFLFGKNAGKSLMEDGLAGLVARGDQARQFVEKHQPGLLAQGFYLFHSRDILSKNGPVVALLPTGDVYRVIAALETNGMNSTEELIAWLRELEKEQPFAITGIGFDFLEGRFTTSINDPAALAKRINTICPEGIGGAQAEARQIEQLRKTGRLYLWWD
jgi:ankyrin repeat protein